MKGFIMYTMEDIQNATPDELAALNRTLGKKVLRNFLMLFAVKWAIVIGINRLGKRLRESDQDN